MAVCFGARRTSPPISYPVTSYLLALLHGDRQAGDLGELLANGRVVVGVGSVTAPVVARLGCACVSELVFQNGSLYWEVGGLRENKKSGYAAGCKLVTCPVKQYKKSSHRVWFWMDAHSLR